jgi:hypothetical protein
MRIPKPWVPILSKKIIDNIVAKRLVKPAVSEDRLQSEASEIILEELTVEDRLNEEVRELLKGHASEIEKGRMDYRRLFDLTKQKLVRERNLIL